MKSVLQAPNILWRVFLLLCPCLGLLFADETEVDGDLPQYSFRDSIQRLAPMDLSVVERGLANVLRNYYKATFSDENIWDSLESVRFDGILELEQCSIPFIAFKKKPDYCKVILLFGEENRMVLAFDGSDAWQYVTKMNGNQPVSMPELEAINFIREATMGGHLLYSGIEGKKMELIGAIDGAGGRAYEIEVTLPDGQIARSFIDTRSFRQIRQATKNQVNGDEEIRVFSDFRKIDGVLFPFETKLMVDGKQVHRSRILKVSTNVGLVSWAFSRTSGAFFPEQALVEAEPVGEILKSPVFNVPTDWGRSVFDIDTADAGELDFPSEKLLESL